MGFSPSEKKNLLARIAALELRIEEFNGRLIEACVQMRIDLENHSLEEHKTQNPPEENKSKKA